MQSDLFTVRDYIECHYVDHGGAHHDMNAIKMQSDLLHSGQRGDYQGI